MNKEFRLLFVFLTFFTSVYSQTENNDFYILYSDASLSKIVSYFLNDLSLVLRNTEVHSLLIKSKTEVSNYQPCFYLSSKTYNRIKVIYFKDDVKKSVVVSKGRYSSIKAIRALLGYRVPLIKKRIIIFRFVDRSSKRNRVDGFGSVYSFNLANILQKTKNFDIVLSNRPYTRRVKKFDVYVYGFYVKTGGFIRLYSYVKDASGFLKFSFKDRFRFKKKDYIYFLDKVARKVSKAIIQEYRPTPPKVVYRERYIVKEVPKEKRKKYEGIGSFSGFKLKYVKVGFLKPKTYPSAGNVEIGGAFYSYLRGFNNKEFTQKLEATNFVNLFVFNNFYIGYRFDLSYDFDLKDCILKTFFTLGGVINISSFSFLSVGLIGGYSNGSTNYYYYGNEFCLKFVLRENFILSIGSFYSFATDMSKINFSDVFRPFLAFSGYF